MSINDEGFLSVEIKDWIEKHHKENSVEFSIADRLRKLGQRVLFASQPKRNNNRQLIVSILFVRVLSHFQGAILLVERGMVADTKILVRVMCEATFSLGACVKDENFVDELVKDDRHREADLVRSLLEIPQEHIGLTDKEIEDLRQRQTRLRAQAKEENPKRLGAFAIAKRAGLLRQYHLIYALLSNTVHAAVRDLDSHVNADTEGEIFSLKWGPDDREGVIYALWSAIDVFFTALSMMLDCFPQNDAANELKKLRDERSTLLEPQK